MNSNLVVALLLWVFASSSHDVVQSKGETLLGMFEGRTPCAPHLVEFTGYVGPGCEKMKWRLYLYTKEGRPSRYEFDGTRVKRQGTWTITRGLSGKTEAAVYQLKTDVTPGSIAFMRADENVLLLLAPNGRLMVGDASWSYTLSRTR